MVRNDSRFKAHFCGALLKLLKFFYDVLTRSYRSTHPTINMKIFGKGTAQQAAGRTEIRDRIDARIGVVNQAGGDVTTDKKVTTLIGDVMAKVLLSLYCTEKGIARTGSKPELVRRLLEAGWNLGPDAELIEDYARLQGKHTIGVVEEDNEDSDVPSQQAELMDYETKEEPKEKEDKKATRITPGTTETKVESTDLRARAPESRGLAAPRQIRGSDLPPQQDRRTDQLYGGWQEPEIQRWLDQPAGRQDRLQPPPAYPQGREYTGYHQLQREGESLFSAFETFLNKLASSIDAQTSSPWRMVKAPKESLRGRGVAEGLAC